MGEPTKKHTIGCHQNPQKALRHAQIIYNQRVDFRQIRDMSTFKASASHLLSRSAGFRTFIESHMKQLRYPQDGYNQIKTSKQDPFNTEISNNDEPLQDNARTPTGPYANESPLWKIDQDQYTNHRQMMCLTLEGRDILMFCPVILHHKVPAHGLIDTGAAISIIFSKLARQTHQPIYSSSKQL